MGNLNTPTEALIAAFREAETIESAETEKSGQYRISRAVSAVAFWYEKLRTAMEYREGYLLRRSAIQRILARKLMVGGDTVELLDSLMRELIWARYLTPVALRGEIRDEALRVISLYTPVVGEMSNVTIRGWAISVMASDLERVLARSFWMRQEALANYAYYFLSRQLEVVGEVEMPVVNVQLYVAVWHGYLRADDEVMAYLLLKQRLGTVEERVRGIKEAGETLREAINLDLGNPLSERLQRFVEHNLPPFLVLRDLLEEYPKGAGEILANEERLREIVESVCEKKYASIHQRVRTAITRSIIYIFLTKMVIAFILEIPIDRLFFGGASYLALFVNSLFPPGLMFALSLSIQTPGKANTERIQRLLVRIINGSPDGLPKTVVDLGHSSRRPVLSSFFSVLYGSAFIVSFGLIYYILGLLHFSIISKGVFVFFVTVVTFFAYRIKRVANQYLFEEKDGLFSPITDFFMVPILRVGRTLSQGLVQINVLLFIVDLLIEMPFKVVFELAEEWSAYIRSKRDEIV